MISDSHSEHKIPSETRETRNHPAPQRKTHMEQNTHDYNDYIASLFAPQDFALTEAIAEMERAGVGDKVEVRVGAASQTLSQLAQEGAPPFDVIFIDADKDGYTDYLRLSLPLLREGGLLLGDNTLPDAVLTHEDSGTKRYNAAVAGCSELLSIILPILRGRGLDGLTVSFKRTPTG